MQGLLFDVTSLLFFAFLLLNTFWWLFLWEEKNHKWKRVFVFLKDTKAGRGLIVGPLNLIKWVVIFSYLLTVFINGIDLYFHVAVFLLYLSLVLNYIRKAYNRDFKLPKVTGSTIAILLFILAIEISLFLFAPLDKYLWMLILDKALTAFIFISIFAVSVYSDFTQDLVINRAIKKINKHRNLLSIIVVGSYARGSTKEFIARLLKSKYDVLENEQSFGTALGISKTILSGLDVNKQIFIAEMEDYKLGDIAEMARIVSPNIAVVTGINDRNISLFGNMNNLLKSKAESLEYLTNDGVAVFNSGNENSLKLSKNIRGKSFFYSSFPDKNSDIYIESIREEKFFSVFNFNVFGKKFSSGKVRLIGRQTIESLLPGILIATHIGIDFSTIRNVLHSLTPLKGSMVPLLLENGVVVIDDTYNININSIEQTVDYVAKYKGNKLIVIEPIEELGKNAKSDHEKIGEMLGGVFDQVFLTSRDYKNEIERGIRKSSNNCKLSVMSPSRIADIIEKSTKKEDVVVLEGKKAERVKNALKLRNISFE